MLQTPSPPLSPARPGLVSLSLSLCPPVFRDEFNRALSANPDPNDYEAYLRILETLANELDLRKYEAQFFELLIVARLLAPGGTVVANDGAEACPFAVCEVEDPSAKMKELVGVWSKLIRRYKYLQKPLEESSLPNILVSARARARTQDHRSLSFSPA